MTDEQKFRIKNRMSILRSEGFKGRYFVSVVAARFDRNKWATDTQHSLSTYDYYSSADEARGAAFTWAEKTFPQNDGWRHHIIVLSHDADNPSLGDTTP